MPLTRGRTNAARRGGNPMHIQIVTFKLRNWSQADYEKFCDEVAPAFAAVPGLVSKVWLAKPDAGTFGGVYTFRDKAAFDAYVASDLFKGVGTHPNLAGIEATDYGVIEGPTAVTRGLIAATV